MIIFQGFREMQENKQQIIGSSTACLMMLSHTDLKLYTANIGDSGFLVLRQGEVVHRSQEQQHYFNTPFQLSLPPPELQSEVLSDRPESADQYEFSVEDGDVILMVCFNHVFLIFILYIKMMIDTEVMSIFLKRILFVKLI